MKENAEVYTDMLERVEGGWSDRPPDEDPGGKTNIGVTLPALSEFLDREATEEDLRDLTPEVAAQVALTLYWGPARCDAMPGGVDLYLGDFAFHSYWTQAVKVLQRIVGVDDDGRVGVKTLRAVRAYDPEKLVRDLHDARLEFLAGLKTYKHNAKGWRRRCNLVKVEALKHVQKRPVLAAMAKSTDARVAAPVAIGNVIGLGTLWSQYGSQAADWIKQAAENPHVVDAATAIGQQPTLPKIVIVAGALLALSLAANGVQLWRARQRYLRPGEI